MRIDPLHVITEILGEPAAQMRNPFNAGYQCPFLSSICAKTGHHIAGPYPVCTVYHGGGASRVGARPICVCPKRFYEIDLVHDVLTHCWPPGPLPAHLHVAHEVTMAKFGLVDMVIADIDPATGIVGTFVSVELQAVDLTGSVEPAYQGVLHNQPIVNVTYNPNWANVRKRFIAQLINKAFYHVHWGMRLVAVLQTPLYNRLHEDIQFDELPPNTGGNTVIFMLYDYVPDPTRQGAYVLKLDRVVGTSHNSLMTASLYQLVPSKEAFHGRILANLAR